MRDQREDYTLDFGDDTISTREQFVSAHLQQRKKRQAQYGTNRAARRAFEADERKGRR